MDKQKQKKFAELYEKFVRKCLSENIFPTPALKYEPEGVIPYLTYYEITEAQKAEIISSLKEKK